MDDGYGYTQRQRGREDRLRKFRGARNPRMLSVLGCVVLYFHGPVLRRRLYQNNERSIAVSKQGPRVISIITRLMETHNSNSHTFKHIGNFSTY